MHRTFIAALAAVQAIASPLTVRDGKPYVGIEVVQSDFGQPTSGAAFFPNINELKDLGGISGYEIKFLNGSSSGVDPTIVECRAYKDENGLVAGSLPFNYNNSALLATNPVEIGSVLCYVVTESEAQDF